MATKLLKAATLEQAVESLNSVEDSLVLAGGTSMMTLLREGLLDTPLLVWLGAVPGLEGVRTDESGTTIGALTRIEDLAGSAAVRAVCPHLAVAAGAVGNIRVRSQATVGGALAHADPRQDVPPALMVSGAEVLVTGSAGNRTVPVAGLATGFMETVLQPDEVITGVVIPPPPPRSHSTYVRFTPGSVNDFPTVSIAARVALDAGGRLTDLAVALGSVSPTPVLVDTSSLEGQSGSEALVAAAAAAAVAAARPSDDRLGSAEYKLHLISVLTTRVLRTLLEFEPRR